MSGEGYAAVLDAPLPGVPSLGLRLQQGRLAAVDFLPQHQRPFTDEPLHAIVAALQAYWQGEPLETTVAVATMGTDFQRRVWQLLTTIPHGEVRRYGQLAQALDSSPRAVAGACRANPLPLLVPCHRVVAGNGIGGYLGATAGQAVAIKRWLLAHESNE